MTHPRVPPPSLLRLLYAGCERPIPAGGWTVILPPGAPDSGPDAGGPEELLARACDGPVEGPDLAAHLGGARRVGVLVPDGTRKACIPRLLPLLLEEIRARAPGAEVRVFMACGAHRPPEGEELAALTGGVPSRPIHAYREGPWRELGATSWGTPVALAEEVASQDALVSLGSVKHHYFAGFGGGPKFLVPGVARIDTLEANHSLAFGEERGFRPGVATGSLEANPLHADIREAAALGPPLYSLHLLIDDAGRVVAVEGGRGLAALRRAADRWAAMARGAPPAESFPVILAAAGAPPDDVDLVQAHKGLDAASAWLEPSGELFYAAACPEGVGPRGADELLDLADPDEVARRMRAAFSLRGIFAWALLAKARAYTLHLLSEIEPDRVRAWGLIPHTDPGSFLAEAAKVAARAPRAALLPRAARIMPPTLETPCWTS